jgi:hypothetical protein
MKNPKWVKTMELEIETLKKNQIWGLVELSMGKKTI